MKILICAFACSPRWGSEPGVGWQWANELAKSHTVVVLTHSRFREHIEQGAGCAGNIAFSYYCAPWPGKWHDELLNNAGYYAWWLLCITRKAAHLQREHQFDLIHHLTLSSFRYPSLCGLLGVPFVMGPLGGGERAPRVLRTSMSANERRREALRDALIYTGRWDPVLWLTYSTARVLFCKTQETINAMPRWARRKALIQMEVGSPTPVGTSSVHGSRTEAPLKIMTVTRLVGWKGVHLALRSVAGLRDRGKDFTLDIVGKGPMRESLHQLSADLGLEAHVRFHNFMPQTELFEHYARADCFLFPSLHDSGGSVVLEALSRGLPVVCLDLGGPKHLVNVDCARVISTRGLEEAALVDRMTDELEYLVDHPDVRLRMSKAALDLAAQRSWSQVVDGAYRQIQQVIAKPHAHR